MGGLSLMSVTVMMAVAVLERPKFRLPSISVACTMMVYWDTFCERQKQKNKKQQCAVIPLLWLPWVYSSLWLWFPGGNKADPVFCSVVAVRDCIWNTESQRVRSFVWLSLNRLGGTWPDITPSESCTVKPPHRYSMSSKSSKALFIQYHSWTDVKTMIRLTEINSLPVKQ